jgi:glycosyltransferase involved in cell wall biosynthesis
LSILETLFFGKPVIAFSIGGIPEVVGDAGYLHAFGDLAGMAASLDALVESPERALQMGRRGLERAEAHFTAAHIVPRYEALYRQVVKN